jgi:hypothetical protein
MITTIARANNLTDTIAPDPHGMSRPRSYEFSASSVCTAPVFSLSPASSTIAANVSVTLTALASGSPAPVYDWYKADAAGTITAVQLNGSASLTVNSGTATAQYWAVAKNSCRTTRSDVATITVNGCKAPAINSSATTQNYLANASATLTVAATGTAPLHYAWYKAAQGVTSNPVGGDSSSLTVTAISSTTYWVRVSNTCGSADSDAYGVNVALAAPLTATTTALSTTSPYSITVSWTAAAGAHHYELERSSRGSTFTKIFDVTAPTVTKTDTGVQSGVTYVYRVRAVDAAGTSASAYSTKTLGTVMTFTSVQPGTPITFLQLNELLAAVNAVRLARGSAQLTWTSAMRGSPNIPGPSAPILANHIFMLRSWLDVALTELGVPTTPYAIDPGMSPLVPIRAAHITAIQQRATKGQ